MGNRALEQRLAVDAGTRSTVLHGDQYGGPPRFGPVTKDDLDAALLKLIANAGGSLTVEEVDGSPSGAVTKIKFPNGTLSIASGVATYTPAGGGSGTVTSVDVTPGTGIASSGGPVTGSGAITVGLAAIANQRLLANISGGSAAPIPNTLSAILDSIVGTTQGALLMRNAGTWTIVSPGTSGYVLTSNGAGANPSYQAASTGTSYQKGAAWSGAGFAIVATQADVVYATAQASGTIVSATMIGASASGSAQVEVWKAASGLPTSANKISASAPMSIASGIKSIDTTLTGWSTSITAGDTFGFKLLTSSNFRWVTAILQIAP